jgi:hypothetical protein
VAADGPRDAAARDRDRAATRARAGYVRDETAAARLDRNYAELLQELRVAQTGVQILFAFLLSIAFQQRFAQIEDYQRYLYLGTLACAACAAILLIAPVAVHRVMFRQHLKDEVVALTARSAAIGLGFLGLAMMCAVFLIADVVSGTAMAVALTAPLSIVVLVAWYLMPSLRMRSAADQADQEEHG